MEEDFDLERILFRQTLVQFLEENNYTSELKDENFIETKVDEAIETIEYWEDFPVEGSNFAQLQIVNMKPAVKIIDKNDLEFSYYNRRLFDYLNDMFPLLKYDKKFIEERGDKAAEAYTQRRFAGDSPIAASEFASNVLFEGLLFSPFSAIKELMCDLELEDDKLDLKALIIFQKLDNNNFFDKFSFHDNFEDDKEYNLFIEELKKQILNGDF